MTGGLSVCTSSWRLALRIPASLVSLGSRSVFLNRGSPRSVWVSSPCTATCRLKKRQLPGSPLLFAVAQDRSLLPEFQCLGAVALCICSVFKKLVSDGRINPGTATPSWADAEAVAAEDFQAAESTHPRRWQPVLWKPFPLLCAAAVSLTAS